MPRSMPTASRSRPRRRGSSRSAQECRRRGTRPANAGERRIRREEIDGGNAAVGGSGSGGSMGPMLSPGGSVGLGGKF